MDNRPRGEIDAIAAIDGIAGNKSHGKHGNSRKRRMDMYDYDEEPGLNILQVLMGFLLGMIVCGVISLIF